MDRLRSPSLLLDPLDREDYPWICALYADPEVMRFIGSGVRSEQQSRTNLDALLAQAERLGFGYWMVRERETAERVGGALLIVRREGTPVELGFAFARAFWGKGFATEAARALVDHAFGDLRIPLLQAFTDVDNAASGAVLRKAGFRDAGLTAGPYGGTDRRFVLTREEWLAARPAGS
ncbi:MAG TPA: GNAT family N-acetyltransferase [Myxococcales bacterium]|nr:GNAT family N-acetyltransferase [Myxococcales bacterium]